MIPNLSTLSLEERVPLLKEVMDTLDIVITSLIYYIYSNTTI